MSKHYSVETLHWCRVKTFVSKRYSVETLHWCHVDALCELSEVLNTRLEAQTILSKSWQTAPEAAPAHQLAAILAGFEIEARVKMTPDTLYII
jgi:hypothetical protein